MSGHPETSRLELTLEERLALAHVKVGADVLDHLSRDVTVDVVREYMRGPGSQSTALWEWDCEVLIGMLAAFERGQP